MKRSFTQWLAVALLMLILVVSLPVYTETATTSGTDGDICWNIKGDTLTLSAVENSAGKMKGYSLFSRSPWQECKAISGVKHVVIKDGITELGTLAFNSDNIHFNTMSISGNIETIPTYFCKGVSIDTLYINENVGFIENAAFYGVIKKVYLPNSLGVLNIGAFGVNNSTGDGIISFVDKIYGYTGTVGERYVLDYLDAIQATNSSYKMWKDGRKYALDCDGDGELDANPTLSFVALDKPSVLQTAKIPSKLTISSGKKGQIKITIPSYLKLVSQYSGMEGQVKATYKSQNSRIATVDKKGKITSKKKGTVKITTTLQLQNGVKKKYTTTVTVK